MPLNEKHAHELLPKTSLLGRRATHPELGRGIIIRTYADQYGTVWCASEKEDRWVSLDDLTLDPVELTNKCDFENAPRGTVVEDELFGVLYKRTTPDTGEVRMNCSLARAWQKEYHRKSPRWGE